MIVDWAEAAKADLQEIGDYHHPVSPEFTLRLLLIIDHVLERLCAHPDSGALVGGKPLRKALLWPTPYLLFYRVTPPTLEVARIIHGARDWFNEL